MLIHLSGCSIDGTTSSGIRLCCALFSTFEGWYSIHVACYIEELFSVEHNLHLVFRKVWWCRQLFWAHLLQIHHHHDRRACRRSARKDHHQKTLLDLFKSIDCSAKMWRDTISGEGRRASEEEGAGSKTNKMRGGKSQTWQRLL